MKRRTAANDNRAATYRLTFDDAVQVHLRVMRGEQQQTVAWDYRVNQGRISEVISGDLHPGSRAVAERLYQKSA